MTTYRTAPARTPTRSLTVHIDKRSTALFFMLFGLGMAGDIVYEGIKTMRVSGNVADLQLGLLIALFPLLFFAVGVHSWFSRVVFVQHDDGIVTMTWKRAPLRGRTIELVAEEVTDVVAEFSRVRPSKATVVVVTKNARIPLSQADSDGHESTLPQLREFFGLALPAEAGA